MDRIKLKRIDQTCRWSPNQWEGTTHDGKFVYIRSRWERVTYGVGDTLADAIRDSKEYHGCDAPAQLRFPLTMCDELDFSNCHVQFMESWWRGSKRKQAKRTGISPWGVEKIVRRASPFVKGSREKVEYLPRVHVFVKRRRSPLAKHKRAMKRKEISERCDAYRERLKRLGEQE